MQRERERERERWRERERVRVRERERERERDRVQYYCGSNERHVTIHALACSRSGSKLGGNKRGLRTCSTHNGGMHACMLHWSEAIGLADTVRL